MDNRLDGEKLREGLASYAHDAWSGWMKYMFEKGQYRGQFKTGSEGEIEIVWIMPAWAVERWRRQMNTPYADLPDSEKESDRLEADRMIEVIDRTPLVGVANTHEITRGSIQGLAYNALRCDGAHHKQWFLEEILKLVSKPEEHERVREEWKAGIAP